MKKIFLILVIAYTLTMGNSTIAQTVEAGRPPEAFKSQDEKDNTLSLIQLAKEQYEGIRKAQGDAYVPRGTTKPVSEIIKELDNLLKKVSAQPVKVPVQGNIGELMQQKAVYEALLGVLKTQREELAKNPKNEDLLEDLDCFITSVEHTIEEIIEAIADLVINSGP